MNRLRIRDDRGFTLIELLAVMVFVGIIMAMLSTLFIWGFRHVGRTGETFDKGIAGLDILREMTDGFTYESHRVPGLFAAETVEFKKSNSTPVLSYTAAGQSVEYVWSPSTAVLTRKVGSGTARVLINDVRVFAACTDEHTVKLTLEQKGIRPPVSRAVTETQVYLRNAEAESVKIPACE